MTINAERSYTEYNVEVPTTDFPIGFDILDDRIDVVVVTLNDVDPTTLGYTVIQVNGTTYRFAPAVPSGVVRLTRITDIDRMVHVFTEGAIFVSENMDSNFKQIRHAQQEVQDTFSSLAASTSVRLGAFSDRVDNLNSEFISTRDVVSDLVTISADTVNTANTAFNTANAIDAKASTALSNSSIALNTANSIDAKATDALDNSLAASLASTAALNTANGIDAKATEALADSAEALSSATTALNTANAIDGKATQALTNSTGALKSSNNLSDVSSATVARTNLGVLSASEVATAISNATPTIPDATVKAKGIVRLADSSDISNNSETVAVSPKDVTNMLVGVGSISKGFRVLFSARLTQMVGTNTSSGTTITATITAHGLAVGDVIQVNYRYSFSGINQEAFGEVVTVTSVTNANTFVFTSPLAAIDTSTGGTCTLSYVIRNKYNINSLTINAVGRYTISINAASGITGTGFIPLISATTSNNSVVLVQPEAITSSTSLTVRTFNVSGAAITPQWLHIGVAQ